MFGKIAILGLVSFVARAQDVFGSDFDKEVCLTGCSTDYWACVIGSGAKKCQYLQHNCAIRCRNQDMMVSQDSFDQSYWDDIFVEWQIENEDALRNWRNNPCERCPVIYPVFAQELKTKKCSEIHPYYIKEFCSLYKSDSQSCIDGFSKQCPELKRQGFKNKFNTSIACKELQLCK